MRWILQNIPILIGLSSLGALSLILFNIYLFFLLKNKEKELNSIIIIYILMGVLACVIFGFMHNFFVNPLFFNSIIRLDFSNPLFKAFLIVWAYRAGVFFLIFSVGLRITLKKARQWDNKEKVFKYIIAQMALISLAWFTDFEKILFVKNEFTKYHFLNWIGGIIGPFILIILGWVLIEKKVIAYLGIKKSYNKIKTKLIVVFVGSFSVFILSTLGILIGTLGIDPSWLIILKVFIYSILFLIVILVLNIAITGQFLSNLSKAKSFLQNASNKDFTSIVQIKSGDEFKDLGDSLVQLKGNMAEVIDAMKNSSQKISSTANLFDENAGKIHEEVGNFFDTLKANIDNRINFINNSDDKLKNVDKKINEISLNISDYSKITEKNYAAFNEMNITFNNITKKTNEATNISTILFQIVETGQTTLNQTIEAIKDIKNTSTEINKLNTIIEDFATKIDLLAINASIEAAHSGSTGEGFAVVAQEMRKLSVETTKSVKGIDELVKKIIGKISNTSNLIEDTHNAFLDISKKVEETKSVNQEISDEMNKENDIITNLLYMSMKITNTIQEIIKSINDLTDSSKDMEGNFKHLSNISIDEQETIDIKTKQIIEIIDELRKLKDINLEISERFNLFIQEFKI